MGALIPIVPELDVSAVSLAGSDELVLSAGPSFGLVALRFAFRDGAAGDGAASGMGHLAFEMLERGTLRHERAELHRAFERIGADLDATVGRTASWFDLRVPASDLGRALDLLLETLTEPRDATRELRELLDETGEEIAASMEEPGGAVQRALGLALWPRRPWGRPTDGLARTRRGATRALVRARRTEMLGRPLIAGLAADDPGAAEPALRRFIRRLRRAFPQGPALPDLQPPTAPGAIHAIRFPTATQAAIFVAAETIPVDHPDIDAFFLCNAAFGAGFQSPLVRRLRAAEGLSYGVTSRVIAGRGRSLHLFSADPEGSRAAYTVRAALDCWRAFEAAPLRAEYLDEARAYAIGQHLIRLETARQRAGAAIVLRLQGLPVTELWQFPHRLLELSVRDVRGARKHFAWTAPGATVVAALPEGAADPGWRRELPHMEVVDVPLRRLV